MTRYYKNLLIWALFGVFWGKTVAMAIIDYTSVSTLDWMLIILGGVAAIIHYLPDKAEEKEEEKE